MLVALLRILLLATVSACTFSWPQAAVQRPGFKTGLSPVSTKRSFHSMGCRGRYNKFRFHELGQVCTDCFTLYKEPELYGLCRSQCFTNEFFMGCLRALSRHDEADRFQAIITRISGRK